MVVTDPFGEGDLVCGQPDVGYCQHLLTGAFGRGVMSMDDHGGDGVMSKFHRNDASTHASVRMCGWDTVGEPRVRVVAGKLFDNDDIHEGACSSHTPSVAWSHVNVHLPFIA